jgi:hypothetical protein
MKIWPYVTLGFGGLLNKFPETDDVGALYFQYGGGFSFKLTGAFRVRAGASFTLFSWDQEEVSLNSTVTYPAFTLGVTWRHEVPEEILTGGEGESTLPAGAAAAGR